MFLSTFFFRMSICHKLEITYLNVNELSRFKSNSDKNVLDVSNKKSRIKSNFIRMTMSVTIIKNTDDFLKRVAKELIIDDIFKKNLHTSSELKFEELYSLTKTRTLRFNFIN